MSYSINAQFHISLIPQRWYNNNKYDIEQKKNVTPVYHIGGNESCELEQPLSQLSFRHLANFRKTPNIVVQLQGSKQKYGFGMGYAKKALDLAIRTDKVNEFVDQIRCFIENIKAELAEQQENIDMHIGDPLQVRHKGRQPNRYRSCGEPQKKKAKYIQDITNITKETSQDNNRKERCCKKCHQLGHYVPRCPN